eukprot:maker-scaffold224_size251237-snap-gene-0.21 protein:Tk05438 transcript:maker-scaffold224_size251237-snap-gene-0.21-mRNA-1 annotation:"hypothetical protein DAPPUDRAFT_202995"
MQEEKKKKKKTKSTQILSSGLGGRSWVRALSGHASSGGSMDSNVGGSLDLFGRILARFPTDRCLTFAYGSGVFQQAGHKPIQDNMTDLIITVNDPEAWHRENRIRNPKDYSTWLRLCGPKVITDIQDKWGARLFFNTLIPFENGLIKYGVISKDAMLGDLLDWESLYAAGRLHKPVLLLEKDTSDQEIHTALRLNLQSALHTTLLMLPETFTEEEFYLVVAALSYTGDFRMVVGEDKNKVANIVRPNIPRFRELYAKRILSLNNYLDLNPVRSRGEQDTSSAGRHHHLSQLPKNLQWYLVQEWNKDGRYRDVEDVLRAAAFDKDSDSMIRKALIDIIGKTSVSQAVKGILTAGLTKTVKYSGAKLKKMAKSMKKS